MDYKPDDKYWKQHLSLPLWQLIVLSLDIEPRSLIPGFNEGEFHGWPNAEKQKAYSERRSVALNHLRNGNLKLENPFQQRRYGYEYYMDVLISDFVSWIRSSTINWKIPKWLKDLELNVEQPEAPKKPNTKEENTWAKLLAVVLTMEPLNYSQPHHAANIIQAQGKAIGVDLGERTIADKIKMISSIKKCTVASEPEPQISE
jgi:hypothetical protein